VTDTVGRALDRPVIVTKVRPPRRRRDLLHRQRLIDELSRHVDRKLILVSAPAGYGKTSLLVDYVSECDLPVCWYRIDESDADPAAFFEYLVASLRQRYPEVGEPTLALLHAEGTTDIEALIGSLVNDVAEQIGEFFLLVLDDYQNLDAADAAVDALLRYLPDNCQVIILTRALPRRPTFTRLAAEGQVVGIGQEQLRFTAEEICQLLRLQQRREPSEEECARLAGDTEGW
jgi:ATP/maltotriose-dependent transcriptional regulator MalT